MIKESELNGLQKVLVDTNGKIFTAHFIKKNGEIRVINCRLNVTKHIKGTGKPSFTLRKDNPYILVYDLKAKDYRTINLDTLFQINYSGKTFVTNKEAWKVVEGDEHNTEFDHLEGGK